MKKNEMKMNKKNDEEKWYEGNEIHKDNKNNENESKKKKKWYKNE